MRIRLICGLVTVLSGVSAFGGDRMAELQVQAIEDDRSPLGHWGTDPERFTQWGTHSNRLIPVYTFGTLDAGLGIDLRGYTGEKSPYRDEEALRQIYGFVPENSVSPQAVYCDQTNLAQIQQAALTAGKKYLFLVVFDGMDWQTTFAAATYRNGEIAYTEGRGRGLHFQDYDAAGTSQFGWMVTSPSHDDAKIDVNEQAAAVKVNERGGYDPSLGGNTPWAVPAEVDYLIGKSKKSPHAVPDSAETATAMMSGLKTYNGSIQVDRTGGRAVTVAHVAQGMGYGVGIVSSVPISHATPASAYAHNVTRNDYQDISRDLLGLPSVSHPDSPLPGLDVVIGAGFGSEKKSDPSQGDNFVPGNRYLAEADLKSSDSANGGKYIVVTRQAGVAGSESLKEATDKARKAKSRLLGFYGTKAGHLPFQTANGDYNPVIGRDKKAESYTDADRNENPTLEEMTNAAIDVLSARKKGFWLLVEAGDVDWANHDNNLDNSIGAVFSGDTAVKAITDWVETNSNWQESLMIVTADHGHYLFLNRPELIVEAAKSSKK